jgi:hypothetical protein
MIDIPKVTAADNADGSAEGVFTPSDSPCVAVCSTLFDEICRGCGRTVTEVSNWVFMSEAQRQVVWERIRGQGYPRRKS